MIHTDNQPVTPLPIKADSPWLAPLAGHTDLAFRVLCRENGAAVACTEMVSAKGLVYGEKSRKKLSATRDLLLTAPLPGLPAAQEADSPLVVQLFGEDPDFLAEALHLLLGWGYNYFDLNMGCSVPKVIKTGAGSALSRYVDGAVKAAEAMLAVTGPGRLGFKFRLGWNREEENYLALGPALESAGAAWLTLHPRYARQGFSGQADWSALAKLKKCVKVPVIASGDLFRADDALTCLCQTGVDGVMFGRGALQNPAIFKEYIGLLQSGGAQIPETGTAAQADRLKKLVLRHAELAKSLPVPERVQKARENRPDAALLKMRGAIPRYIKNLPGSSAMRRALSTCENWNDFYILVDNYFSGLKHPG